MSNFLKNCVAAFVLVGVQIAVSATAQELKLAHFMSPRHVMQTDVMAPWAEELAKASGGRLTVKIFPGSQLGGRPPGQYKLAVDGIADIAFGLQGYTSSIFPLTSLIELPDFGKDGAQNTERLWAIYPKYLSPEYKDVHVLALWANDEAILMTKSKPIRTLEDLKGMKVRTPSAMQSKVIKTLGGTPIDMPVTEMYNALDRGVVDALWVGASVILDFKLNEVARYYTTGLPSTRSPFFLVMNKAKYEALPEDLRQALDRISGKTLSLNATEAFNRRAIEALEVVKKSGGELITLSTPEAGKWREALQPMAQDTIADAEKAGVPAREMLTAAGYLK